MTITQNVNPLIFLNLSEEIVEQIVQYIEDPMTATTFYDANENKNHKKNQNILLKYFLHM